LLIVDYESDIRQEALGSAILLGVLGVVVLLALEIGLWLALRQLVLGRLDRMEAVAGQVAQGALSERIDDPGQDEISRLGQAFDGMAGQLQSRLNELQASRGFLQSLIDAIPDGVRVIDADFNIVMANKAYCAQLGYEPGSVTGQLCHLSSHGREQPCISTLVRCPVAEILQGGSDSLKCNHTHVGADGADVSVEVSAVPATMIIDGIERPCIVESIRDLETGLAISQEQRLAEMGMLAAGVAHEVNNPLSSIALALHAIGAEPGQTDKAMKYVDIAEREITNCKNITESLLRLAAAPQSRPELVNMGEAVSDTMSLLKLQADQTEVILHKEVTGQPRVLASDSDMRILVFNLTLNAIHAMPQGGCVTVRCFRNGNMIRLEVEDQGIGIAARDRDKILLPFWTRRADGSRGRGLGLAISLSIVKSLGGTLDFESTLGEGTCFIVNLPSAEGTDE
jgi:PAS domain S-box-containing protein